MKKRKESYAPGFRRVPMGYQPFISVYHGRTFYSTIENDDTVFDNEMVAYNHAKREIERLALLDYAVAFWTKNATKLKPFEREGYMGLDLSYAPHGIRQGIWKEAYAIFKGDKI